ncbi:metal transporter CNNM4-like [Octopus sinensis]|uniref:Metal transporter CNNM4-like n=1 Tax=Octopus sinensis TaxID=2607531 RepID=A0A6P7TQN9_9MOLL|nr:metal transporter CNNM4-like [Octopus sinensis]
MRTILLLFFIDAHSKLIGYSPGVDNSVSFSTNKITAVSLTNSTLRAIGNNLHSLAYTQSSFNCTNNSLIFPNSFVPLGDYADIMVIFPHVGTFFSCLCTKKSCEHQGNWTAITVIKKPHAKIPLWIAILLVIICVLLSALFSGLNLGLMSLKLTELEIFEQCGSALEKSYARIIRPVRKHGNYLLCTILFGNVLVMTSLTIILTELVGPGFLAGIYSSFSIVIIGEIVPQAICSRHGLMIGAKTIWLTKLFMVMTFPLSFPVSFVLTKLIGENIDRGYSNEQLMALISIETQRDEEYRHNEMDIINGALQISKKMVGEVMTYIDNVFMLGYDAVLDFETLQKIAAMGFTRIPIFGKSVNDIVAILNVKHLMVADPDACLPVRTVCDFYRHQLITIREDTPLDVILKIFISGKLLLSFLVKSHMAIVLRGDGSSDVVGVITLEDIVEEIIQAEIIDETDIISYILFSIFSRQPQSSQKKYKSKYRNSRILSLSTQVDAYILSSKIKESKSLSPFTKSQNDSENEDSISLGQLADENNNFWLNQNVLKKFETYEVIKDNLNDEIQEEQENDVEPKFIFLESESKHKDPNKTLSNNFDLKANSDLRKKCRDKKETLEIKENVEIEKNPFDFDFLF